MAYITLHILSFPVGKNFVCAYLNLEPISTLHVNAEHFSQFEYY